MHIENTFYYIGSTMFVIKRKKKSETNRNTS